MGTRLLGAISACLFSLSVSPLAQSAVIDAYFGMNFVSATAGGFEVNLKTITYIGAGGTPFTATMPVFSGPVFNNPGQSRTGMPDIDGQTGLPTYTNGGDGESTRTVGVTIPINWDMSGSIPTISIIGLTADALDFTGEWSADFLTPYTVGLIPLGADNELSSSLSSSQADIYSATPGTAFATSAPPAFSPVTPGALFGDFTFSAAAVVPVPPALWLFGSGLVGLIGIAKGGRARKQHG